MAAEGHKGSALALTLLNKPTWFFSITLLGTNLAIAANTILTTAWIIGEWKYGGEWLSALLMPPFILILGEIIPKMVFQQHAQRLAPKLAYGIVTASYVFFPAVWIFSYFSRGLTGNPQKSQPNFVTREELKLILRMDEEEVELDKAERKLIRKMFSFTETIVSRVMIPLIKVSALPEETLLRDAVITFQRSGYGRLPIYRKRVDKIIGILNAFDLIGDVDENQPVSNIMRSPCYVPETKPVAKLLVDMQKEGETMAVVVDEYGGAIGIVTVEDLLEEIMGEMADEFDQEMPPFAKLGPRRFLLKGRMEISHINEQLRLELPKGDYETVAGFILKELGFIPKEGFTFSYGNLQFFIRKADPRTIEEIEITIKRKGQKK